MPPQVLFFGAEIVGLAAPLVLLEHVPATGGDHQQVFADARTATRDEARRRARRLILEAGGERAVERQRERAAGGGRREGGAARRVEGRFAILYEAIERGAAIVLPPHARGAELPPRATRHAARAA